MTSAPSSRSPTPRRFLHPPRSAAQSTTSKSSCRSRKNIFLELCALNWILEGMSQDQQPPVMPPITSCWKLKDLKEDPIAIRKRVEKDKATDKDWVAFKQNPARFTQRGTRRGTGRISIHPNFIQQFSTTNNSGVPSPTVGPSALRVPSEARPRNGTSVIAETVMSSRTEIQTEPALAQRVNQEGSVSEGHGNSSQSNGPTVTFVDPKIRAVSAPPGSISDQSAVTPGALPVTMTSINPNGPHRTERQEGPRKRCPLSFRNKSHLQ